MFNKILILRILFCAKIRPMKSDLLRDRKKEKGQALVEFALTFVLFLFLVFGIIEVGRLLFNFTAITAAAREGARWGAAAGGTASTINRFEDCSGVRDAAVRIGQYAGIRNWDVKISYDQGNDTPEVGCTGDPSVDCCPAPPASIDLGDRVIVRVVGTYEPFVGWFNLPTFDIESISRRTIVKDVEIQVLEVED